MIPELRSLASTRWSDPRARLLALIDLLDDLSPASRDHALSDLTAARGDTPAALWFSESVVVNGRRPRELGEEIRDGGWADRLALALVDAPTVGALSMGRSTRDVIAALRTFRAESPVVRSASSVIARGLDDLGVLTEVGDPSQADKCLIPVAAFVDGAFWTSPKGAEAYGAVGTVGVRLDDPVTRLGPWAVDRYRPPDWMVLVETRG